MLNTQDNSIATYNNNNNKKNIKNSTIIIYKIYNRSLNTEQTGKIEIKWK